MKAALFSLGSKSSLMILEGMKKYFEEVDNIPLKEIEVRLGKEAGVYYHGEIIGNYDCVYLRGSFRYANLLRSISALWESNVPYMPLTTDSFTTVHNKLLTHLILQQYGIPMPRTYVSSTVESAKELLKVVRYPIVMKFPEGTQGKGVMFADSYSSASSLLDALGVLNQPFIIQEYVETGGTDIRALVVGEKIIAAMKRKAQTEEKRANIHAGGVGEPVILSRAAINLALDTAKSLGADICGVDILEGPLEPLVIEANISPGLQGLSKVSTLNLPDEIAKFLHRKTQEILSKGKNKTSTELLNEVSLESNNIQQIITDLPFRGERVLLPELVTKLAKLKERKEYNIKVKKGKIEIEEV